MTLSKRNNQIRILWADNLKGFLILLVVLGHVIQYSIIDYGNEHIFNYIYSFHMPLFMAISGFVSYKKACLVSWGWVKRSSIQLLIPYILWTLLAVLLINGSSLSQWMITNPFYWFLVLLFLIRVLMICCQKLSSFWGIHSEISCTTMVLLLFFLHGIIITNVLSLNILHVHFLFYTLGWYARKYEPKSLRTLMIIPFGIAFLIFGWFYKQNSSSFFTILPPSFYFIFSGIVGSLFWASLFKRYANRDYYILALVGRLTLGIYVTHLLICNVLEIQFRQWLFFAGKSFGIMTIFIVLALLSTEVCLALRKNRCTRFIV